MELAIQRIRRLWLWAFYGLLRLAENGTIEVDIDLRWVVPRDSHIDWLPTPGGEECISIPPSGDRDGGIIPHRQYEVCIDRDRPDDRVAFVRAGLRDAIAHKYARGTQTLDVYLLDPEIERALAAYPAPESVRQPPKGLDDTLYTRIANTVRSELEHLPPMAQLPVILTRDDLRATVSATLAQEFPQLAVVSYADLPPNWNIQQVAHISWR